VDRIFAIWQGLNSQTWDWEQRLLEGASFITPLGTEETPESPLVPFRKGYNQDNSPRWWTSNEVRDCRSIGYLYPELAKPGVDERSLRQWVIDNYEWATICGTPPPWKTLYETVDLKRVESLPPVLRIDGKGPQIERPEGEERPSLAASISKTMSSWFHRRDETSPHDRYKHLGILVEDGKLIQWNLTIKVKKYDTSTFQIYVIGR
jgi:hypothetical protein